MAAAVSGPFVGRTREREALCDLVAGVAGRRSAAVVVEGEAGIGKTRLLDEVLGRSSSAGLTIMRWAAQELDRSRPFGAIAGVLGVDHTSSDPARVAIAEMLWGSVDDSIDSLAAVAAGPGLHYRVLEAMVGLVTDVASARPAIVAIEDLHWADPSSLLVLHALRRRLDDMSLGLVLTARPLPRGPVLDRVLEEVAGAGTHLVLAPLGDDDVETLAEAVGGSPPGESLRRQLSGARGNPFYVIELLRALRQEEELFLHAGRVEVGGLGLPPSLRLMLLRRLSYLTEETLALLRVASVLGSSFAVPDLGLATGRSAVELMPFIDEATKAGVLGEAGPRLAFRHDLLRDAIYGDLSPALRAGLHLEVGRALAAAGAPAIQVAEHLALGASRGDRQAVRWLHDAAREALSRAPEEAVTLCERAVALTGPAAPGPDALLADLVVAKLWAGRVPEAEVAARELLERDHDGSVDGLVRLALIEALIAQGRTVEAVHESAIALAEEGLPGGVEAQLRGFASLGLLFTGDLDAATDAAAAARADGERLADPVAVCLGLNSLSMIATVQGHCTDGLQLARQASQFAQRGDHSGAIPFRWQTDITVAVTSMDADRFLEAEAALVEGRRRSEDLAVMWPLPLYQWALVWLAFRKGAWDDAVAEAQAGFEMVAQGRMRFGAVSVHSALAMIATHRNDLRTARSALAAAETELEVTGPQYLGEWVLWAKALLEEASGRDEAAIAALEQAWELCSSASAAVIRPEIGPDLVRLLVLGEAHDRAAVVPTGWRTWRRVWQRRRPRAPPFAAGDWPPAISRCSCELCTSSATALDSWPVPLRARTPGAPSHAATEGRRPSRSCRKPSAHTTASAQHGPWLGWKPACGPEEAETTIIVEEADVGVDKTDVADPVAAGTSIEYRFRVDNQTGPSTASKVTLTDMLPQGVTFTSSTGPCSADDIERRHVACHIGALPVGESREFTVTGHVDADLVRAMGGFGSVTIVNDARVGNSGGPDPVPDNNDEDEETKVIEVADLSVAKSDAPDPVGAGTPLDYTVTVTNGGPSTASRPRVVDTLPADVEHRSDTGDCTKAPDGSVVCELGAIPVGESRQVSLGVLVGEDVVCRSGGPVTITNRATAENPGATDPVDTNNERSEDTRVVDNQVGGSAFAEKADIRFAGLFGITSGPAPVVSAPTRGCGRFRESRSVVSAPGTNGTVSLRGLSAGLDGDRSGPDAFVHSYADVADAAIALAGITLEGIHSECTSSEDGSTASTSIGRLVVAGRASVDLRPNPNSEIRIPGVGVLVLNEQVRSDRPPTGTEFGRSSVVVTAARLKLTVLGLVTTEVVLAQSTCSIEGLNVLR